MSYDIKYPPSAAIKNWILEPKRTDDASPTFHVSSHEAEAIAKSWRNSTNAELRQRDGALMALVNRNDYRLRRKSDVKEDNSDMRWVCGYGTRHRMHVWPPEECGCKEKFATDELEMLRWCQETYGINMGSEIQEHMQEEFLRCQSLAVKDNPFK